MPDMGASPDQARIDATTWYHEFDFGDGLKARSKSPDVGYHRALWRFIEQQLDRVDFRDKTVLDVGCWDGYWSFYAERRGARSVLATDDRTQNWADGNGLLLAKELFGSAVAVNQDLSVYQLASLNRQFDVILFMGVYYHLLDPFYAFSQIRHCCHPGTLLLVEGSEALALRPNEALYNYPDHRCEFLPTFEALEQVLQATYFTVSAHAHWSLYGDPRRQRPAAPAGGPQGRLGWRWRLRMCKQALKGSRSGVRELARRIDPPPAPGPPTAQLLNGRVFLACAPFEGVRDLHLYRPPFGLHRYDQRFAASA
jgi:tRNA (mo5U34)-methyltransferase